MSALRPFLRLWLRHPYRLALGIVLAIVTLLASIGLLTLSGWFLAASSVAGVAGLIPSTICCLRQACVAPPSFALPHAMLNGWSATMQRSGFFSICVSTPSAA